MVPPLSWTTPFLSQGSIWPIFLATPWTAVGDPACPQPAPCSSPYPLALAFTWPFPLHTILGTGQEHSLLQGIPSFLPNTFTLSCQLDFSRKTEYRDVQQETLVERDWVLGSREGALGTLKCGRGEGLFLSSPWPCRGRGKGEGPVKNFVTVSVFSRPHPLLCS